MKVFETIQPMRKFYGHPMHFLWECLYGVRKWAFTGMLLAFCLQLMKVCVPVFFSDMIEYFSKITPQEFSWVKMGYLLAGIFGAFIMQSVLRMVREVLEENRIRNYLNAKIKLFGVDYLSKHSEGYFTGQKTGELSQKVIRCAQEAGWLHSMISRIYSNVFLVLIDFYFIGRVSLWFLLLVMTFGCLSFYFSYRSSFQIRELNNDVERMWDAFTGTKADSIGNALTVKSFGSEDYEISFVQKAYQKARNARIASLDKAQDLLRIQNTAIVGFEICALSLLIYLWYRQKVSVGDVTLVLLMLNTVIMCVIRAMGDIFDMNATFGSLKAAMIPFEAKHDVVDVPKAKNIKIVNGNIEFRNVKFSYDNKTVFHKLNLKISAGEKIGIVGASGSGKSTLINLLQRAYDIQGGEILIDGQNIATVKQSSLHDNIALIPQDTSLFHRTIAQNIAYGHQKASLDAIEKAAKLAYADKFIVSLPKGYQTTVGEKGVKLSGGQRQRIAIARAILKNSPILILDEATSALDSEAEKYIQKAMKNLMKKKTVIAIAHRLSTLKEMDRIIVLDKGKIVEEGKIDELLKSGGQFHHLWKIQEE